MAVKRAAKKRLVNSDEIASLAGVGVTRVHQLRQDGVIEFTQKSGSGPGSAGQYDYDETVQKLLHYYREKADRKAAPNEAMDEEKLLHETAKRELAELKLSMLRKQLHHNEDIKRVFGFMVTRLRTGLMSLPLGVAPLLTGQEDINNIAGIISDRLTKALSEVCKYNFDEFAKAESEYLKELEELDEDEETGDTANESAQS